MAERMTRRAWIRTGTMGLAAAATARSVQAASGANERIRIAVAGLNWQGGTHVESFSGLKDVEVAYVVDPDSRIWSDRIELARKKSDGRSEPKPVTDIRRVLEDKSIDAISIATPNHWHSLMTVWACQAGKDVYVEKPMSHNLREGRVAVQASRKYDRIVQHGTQRRSDPDWLRVIAAIHSGKLGKLKLVRGLCYNAQDGFRTRASIGYKPHKQPPHELDFDLWLGPARQQPYHENLVHYRWHWFWDFGCGDLGNQGVHQMDVARWAIQGATLPKSVIALGGRLGYEDQAEVASTHTALLDFGETKLLFETRGLPSEPYRGIRVGNVFHLDAGTIVEHRFYPNGSDKPADLPDVPYEMRPGSGPYANFIAAMKSRKREELNAECIEGHYSSALCHLANVSIRLGNKVPLRPRDTSLEANPLANEALAGMESYLAANGMDLDKSGFTLGRRLQIDAEKEATIGDSEASALLTRYYRAPFVLPPEIS